MKKSLFVVLALLTFTGVLSQETDVENNSVKNFNLIKIGSSVQIDVYYFGGYDYYYDEFYYPGYDSYYYPDGVNGALYLAYEHIWEFPNKLAISLEPKIGFNFREYATHGMIGNDITFYWANKPYWRMGMAISTDYNFGKHEGSIMVPQANGNYYQQIDLDFWYHNTSIDIAIIPFQFRFKDSPIIIESQFSFGGFSILATRSENYTDAYGQTTRRHDASVYPYFLKGELKIGYVFH